MSIVAISQTHGSLGDAIGRELAGELGYEFADREIIVRAANRFGEDVAELEHFTDETPGLLERFSEAARRYSTYVKAAIWELAAQDHVVLSGRGATFVLAGIRHALRVRVTAPEEFRIERLRQEETLTAPAAVHLVRQRDRERAARIKFLHRVDWNDPCLYDFVLNTERLEVKAAARLIKRALGEERFQPTPESLSEIKDRCLIALAEAALLGDPTSRSLQLRLNCTDGLLFIGGMVEQDEQRKVAEEIVSRIPSITGVVNEITVVPQHLIPE